MSSDSSSARSTIEMLAVALDFASDAHPTMTLGMLRILLETARLGGRDEVQSLDRLAARLDLPYPTLARQTDLLGSGHGGRGGLGLVAKVPAPGRPKARRPLLTAEGRAFVDALAAAMGSAADAAVPGADGLGAPSTARERRRDDPVGHRAELAGPASESESSARREAPRPEDPLTDAEWQRLAPLLRPPSRIGRPARVDPRTALDALLYLRANHIPWRRLPRHRFPPHTTVYNAVRRLVRDCHYEVSIEHFLDEAVKRRELNVHDASGPEALPGPP